MWQSCTQSDCKLPLIDICLVHPIFGFWFLVTFGDEVTKILRNLCLHFARQDGKNRKENHVTKVTKIPKGKTKVRLSQKVHEW